MGGSGHTIVNGAATISSDAVGLSLDGRTLDNAGTVTIADGTVLRFRNRAVWNNENSGTLVLHGTVILLNDLRNPARLNNAGLLVHTGTGRSGARIDFPIDNTGTVNAQNGTLVCEGGVTNEGSFNLAEGALASIGGGSTSQAINLAADSQLTITGNFTQQSRSQVNLADGSLFIIGSGGTHSIDTLQEGAAIRGAGIVQVSAFNTSELRVNGNGAIDNLTVFPGTVVTVAATKTLTLENLTVREQALLGVGDGGGLTAQTLTQTGGFVSVGDTSRLTVQDVTLSGGTLTARTTGILDMQTLTQTGGMLTGGIATVERTLTWTGGIMSGPGRTVVNGTATISGRPSLDGRTLDNAGSATLSDGARLGFGENGVWNNENGATLTLHGNVTLDGFSINSTRLNNDGVLIRLGIDNSGVTFHLTVVNTGTINVVTGIVFFPSLINEGTINLADGSIAEVSGSSSGTFNLEADSQLNILGSFTQQSSATVNLANESVLNIGSGFVGGNYTLQNGATISGAGTVQVNNVFTTNQLNVNGSARIDNLAVNGGAVTVATTSSLALQKLTLSGGTMTIAAAGTLETQDLTQTGGTLTSGTLTGAGTVTVDGTLTWTDGTMSGTGKTLLNGSGTVGNAGSGPLLDGREFDNAGTVTIPNGNTVRFATNALWNNEDPATLELQGQSSVGNVSGHSGRLTNAGLLVTTGGNQATINLPVTNSGTVDLQGGLVINGLYTQTADGTLNVHIGGLTPVSQFDQLQINGLATLGGALNVTLVNGFTPTDGNNFRILTFTSRSGDFTITALPELGSGLFFDLVYDSSGLTLKARSG
jgi:hypothetical protein